MAENTKPAAKKRKTDTKPKKVSENAKKYTNGKKETLKAKENLQFVSTGNPSADRKARKAIAEERKRKRKPNFELEKNLVGLWEKLRQRNMESSERIKLAASLTQKMKGKLAQLAVSHACSRVVQSCVKHATDTERAAMFEELKPHCLELSQNTYAHHLVNKMLEYGTKAQRSQIVTMFYGKVVSLMRHPVASHVVDQAYQLASASQRQALLSEFYSPEFRVFKDTAEKGNRKLADILAEAGEAKQRSILEHMSLSLQPIVEKGIVDHSIVHKALFQFMQAAPRRLWIDILEQLAGPVIVRMLHTREGALIASACIAAGSAKERKKIVKALKDHVLKVAQDDHGNMVLLQIMESVDDTTLVRKTIIAELMKDLKSLALHKFGRRVILHLLAPKVPRYFPADVVSVLKGEIFQILGAKAVEAGEKTESEPLAGAESGEAMAGEEEEQNEAEKEDGGKIGLSKKDPEVRRWELLHDSKLSEALAHFCTQNAEELLRSQQGTDILFEVASGGRGNIMWRSVPTLLPAVHLAIAKLAALPRPVSGAAVETMKRKVPEGEEGPEAKLAEQKAEDHVLDHFFAGRTIRRLVTESAGVDGCPPFSAVLWDVALRGNCSVWAQGHSAKVIAAVACSTHEATKSAAMAELRPLALKGALKSVESFLPDELRGIGGKGDMEVGPSIVSPKKSSSDKKKTVRGNRK